MKKTKTQSQAEEPKKANVQDEGAAYQWEDDAPTGFEGTRAEDMGIPFIYIIQKGSPEIDEDHKNYETKKVEGAKVGHILNSLSRKLVYERDEEFPLQFLPLYHERLYQEWKSRDTGGGFVASHRTPKILTRCQRNAKGFDELENGNLVMTTSYFYGFYFIEGITQPDHEDVSKRPVRSIIGLTSTQLKKAKAWLNMADAIVINGKRPPLYSHIYNLTTVAEENAKGNWWGWKIDICRPLTMADVSIVQESKKLVMEMSQQKLLAAPAESPEPETHDVSDADEMAEAEARRANRRS